MKVTIIDYGLGNLLSIQRAFEYCGAEVIMTQRPDEVLAAEYLVLPGVGAFQDGMYGLQQRGLVEPIQEYATKQRPFLGICLGMQLMMDSSEEFGFCRGLSLIKGPVKAIPNTAPDGIQHKIPHIGWKPLQCSQNCSSWEKTILDGLPAKSYVYFVHSYTPVPLSEDNRLADCYYNGYRLSAVIQEGALYGCQFHPEKSGPVGISIIKNWLRR